MTGALNYQQWPNTSAEDILGALKYNLDLTAEIPAVAQSENFVLAEQANVEASRCSFYGSHAVRRQDTVWNLSKPSMHNKIRSGSLKRTPEPHVPSS